MWLGCLLTATLALAAVAAASAEAAQIGQEGFGLAGTSIPTHQNFVNRDGLASACADPDWMVPTQTTTTATTKYKKRGFQSLIREQTCVTVAVSTACTGTDAVMSETYSPSYDPANILANWIGDLGNNPPAETSYAVRVPAGAPFETVIEQASSGNCGGTTLTWTSDRPWATNRQFIDGVPALGRTLTGGVDIWAGSPAVERQWMRCDSAGANCSAIPGATAANYVVADADLGQTLMVRETATENGNSSSADGPPTEPAFIPFEVHEDQSLAAGDRAQKGRFDFGAAASCQVPKTAPPVVGFDLWLYDAYSVTSLVNEPQCVHAAGPALHCFATLSVYNPSFDPASIAQNYAADDGARGSLSYSLGAGETAIHVVANAFALFPCPSYDVVFGSDAPFATARPAIGGSPAEGASLTATPGSWSGDPTFAYEWRRCDAVGDGCAPIDAASGAGYSPGAADVGHTLRVRVTATRRNSSSADSPPTAVIAAATAVPAGSDGPAPQGSAGDRTAPTVKLALGRTTLQKVAKKGFIPVVATCNEPCAIALRADVARKLRKRFGSIKIASGKAAGKAGKRTNLKLKLTRKARRGLRGRRSLPFTLKGVASDGAQNKRTLSKKATLKRKR